jgi:transposase
LENGEVADLLPDRSAESTEQWLLAHPGAEIISRDRASLYAAAAAKAAWPAWQSATLASPLANFARRLQRDEHAFLAALQPPWSDGPVEGHVHRLKLIKRSMYGRAKFDLLRLRVLHTA